ncbi:MAG: flagellar export protein FliJ [Candidatus Scalindua sp.]|nr:flagellar export protein FliJ [Candidatus Scalindua sp.]
MMRYHFKLQPLLDKERIYEGEFIRGLKSLTNILREEKDKLEKIKGQQEECQKKLEKRRGFHVEISELRLYEEYFLQLENEVINSRYMLDQMTQKIEIVQAELSRIMKRRKALEKLKEKGLSEYVNTMQLSLNKEMDEIAMLNFSKRREGNV